MSLSPLTTTAVTEYIAIEFTSTDGQVMYTVPAGKVLEASICTNNQYGCKIDGVNLLTPSAGRQFLPVEYPAGTVFTSITSGNSTRMYGILRDA